MRDGWQGLGTASPPFPTFPRKGGRGAPSKSSCTPRSLTRAKLMTLALGIPGGALFYLLQLPLPWMLGAMAATTIAAISGVRVALMPSLRLVFVAILGVMLGSAFTPEVVAGPGDVDRQLRVARPLRGGGDRRRLAVLPADGALRHRPPPISPRRPAGSTR